MKITLSFIGRQSGASGIFYKIRETYECDTISEAKSFLYEDYYVANSLKVVGCTEREFSEAPMIKVRSNRLRRRDPDTHLYIKPVQLYT